MVFSSAIFLLRFLPIVFVLNWCIKNEYSNAFLFLASIVFYAWGEPILVLIMLLSIVVNWWLGVLLMNKEGVSRRLILIAGLLFNLGILGYYKYSTFFAEVINDVLNRDIIPIKEISLPIGISFFTFQAISYIVDVYRRKTNASKNIINVALYISFFPQLIAGPIVKYQDINRQIECRQIDGDMVACGFKRFIYGLGKKVLIANVMGLCVDTIYEFDISVIDPMTAWIGAIAYGFQIYYDFSGYSDMAVGLGQMFGFVLPENFKYPYLSASISEFWRRWHISLGSWFREYIYIPMGGSKKGKVKTYFNLGVVFLLTGLWHGADWSFVIWGIYHSFFVIIERAFLNKVLSKNRFLSVLYVNIIVCLGWVIFRAENVLSGVDYLSKLLSPWMYAGNRIQVWEYMDYKTIVVFVIAFLGMGIIQSIIPIKICNKWKESVLESIYCTVVLILSLAAIASDTYNPFIYFQF